MERKDSDIFKTRERLSNMERDMMALKEGNRALKQESEVSLITIDDLKKKEVSLKGQMEAKISKGKEILQ